MSSAFAEGPGAGADAREAGENEVGGGLHVSPVGVAFAGIDEKKATRLDDSLLLAVGEVEDALRHDHRDRDRVAVFLDPLARGQAQTDDPQRPGVGDRLPADRAVRCRRYGPPRT